MTCTNCFNSAKYEVTYPNSPSAVYCGGCLPTHLAPGRYSGTKAIVAEEPEAPKKKRKAADDNPVV